MDSLVQGRFDGNFKETIRSRDELEVSWHLMTRYAQQGAGEGQHPEMIHPTHMARAKDLLLVIYLDGMVVPRLVRACENFTCDGLYNSMTRHVLFVKCRRPLRYNLTL
jgi:hypothetical protein